MELIVDALSPSDWEAVRAIYAEGIATGYATFEATTPDWERWDAARLRAGRLAARAAGRLVGWAALSPVSARPAYAGVAEVSIYVASSCGGQGSASGCSSP